MKSKTKIEKIDKQQLKLLLEDLEILKSMVTNKEHQIKQLEEDYKDLKQENTRLKQENEAYKHAISDMSGCIVSGKEFKDYIRNVKYFREVKKYMNEQLKEAYSFLKIQREQYERLRQALEEIIPWLDKHSPIMSSRTRKEFKSFIDKALKGEKN